MVKHLVLFQLKDELSQSEKENIGKQFKAAIEALPETITYIRHIYVGLNINPLENWDICLDSEFDSLEDIKTYSVHPNHLAASAILKEVKKDRACVDYSL